MLQGNETMLGTVWTSIRNKFFSSSKQQAARSGREARTFHVESLEPRKLLSANQITYQGSTSTVFIEGTTGADTVSVSVDATNIVRVSMTNAFGNQNAAFARASVSQIKFVGSDGNDYFQNTSNIVSNALGEGGNDTLIGGTVNDTLDGGDGDDNLNGADGNDTITGGAGNDFIDGAVGRNTLYGGIGDDTLVAGNDGNVMYGEDGIDKLTGGTGGDWFDGGAGADTITGGAGDDTISGGDGDDN